jgi:MoaA/NifB/PqqE/SkfB family radical SAM enzyme
LQATFFNYGEPLLNKHTPDFIKQARQYLLKTVTSTNLSLKKIAAKEIVASGLNHLIMSIDGVTKETYSHYRRGGNIDYVFSNVQKLVEAKKELNSYTPLLVWQFLVFKHNTDEIALAKKMAKQLKIDILNIAEPYDVSWDDSSVQVADSITEEIISYNYDPELEQINYRGMLSNLDSANIERHFSRSWVERSLNISEQTISTEPTRSTCQWLYKNITVDAHGRVMPCCAAPAENKNLIFSEIDSDSSSETNFSNIFNSDYFRLSRLYFQNPDDPSLMDGSINSYCTECKFHTTPLPINADRMLEIYFLNPLFKQLSQKTKNILADW